ncbi:polysaccharide biosynthesis tyrosine autokinase [Actinomycetota bacterium]
MELQQLLKIARAFWRSILATLLLTVALAAGFTLLRSPTYTGDASVFLTVESGSSAGELSQGATYAEQQVLSYIEVATTSSVLSPVIDKLNLQTTPEKLKESVRVTSPDSTSIIDIAADGDTPERAAQIANEIAASLVDRVEVLSPKRTGGTSLVSANVVDPARSPVAPSAPKPLLNLVLGTILGLMLGLGQAILRSTLDTRVRTTEDLQAFSDAPVLATVGRISNKGDAASARAHSEAYRRLRTNVGFVGLGGERSSSMVVTSSMPGEGKTETAVNLANVLAQAGESVLLVDADLRRPRVDDRMRLDGELGLSDVLTGRGSFEDLAVYADRNLRVLPAGTIPPNPSELLGSAAMNNFIAMAERQFTYVIFDSPPVLPVADATILGSQTGGAILVVRSGEVKVADVKSSMELLDTAKVTLLGLVLNDVPTSQMSERYGYYESDPQRRAGSTPEPVTPQARSVKAR